MRGDLVTIALQGDFGKPRPALVIQADLFDAHASVTLLPAASMLCAALAMKSMPLRCSSGPICSTMSSRCRQPTAIHGFDGTNWK